MIDSKNAAVSDFSIDHILNRAGSTATESTASANRYSWLQCTRYCPPKIPRVQKREVQKRQLGRHPRIPFTSQQLSLLEEKYQQSPYLSSEQVTLLAERLNLADIRVKIWFQNRRARERREKAIKSNEESREDNVSLDRNSITAPEVYSMRTNVEYGHPLTFGGNCEIYQSSNQQNQQER